MAARRRAVAWGVWCALLCGVFNSCGSHRETRATGRWLLRGDFPISLATGWRALRAAARDDGDIDRYFAYANAVLGRPYQGHFIRPLTGWKADLRTLKSGRDEADPRETPPIIPTAPLVPWRDFSVEYPPGFFLLTLPPALLAGDVDTYHLLFSLYMALLLSLALGLGIRVLQRLTPTTPSTVVWWGSGAALALGVITVRRYDPVVALAVTAIAWGLVARRPWLVGAALGLGIATKGLPLLLAPLLLVGYLDRRRWAEAAGAAAATVAVVAALVLPALWLAGARVFDLVAYHGGRPLQIESSGGALLILARLFDPSLAALAQTYGSDNVVADGDGPLRAAATVLPLVGLAACAIWSRRRLRAAVDERARAVILIHGLSASLVATMTLGKVFSPQYVTWLLIPGLVSSLLADRTARILFIAALALTQLDYPFAYGAGLANALHPLFGALVLLRNSLLLVWAVRLLRAPAP